MPKSTVGRFLSVIGSFAVIAGLSACNNTPPIVAGAVPSAPVTEYGQDDFSVTLPENYTLRPSDVISVTVFREPQLSVERVPIAADGTLSLPLIGDLNVGGVTTRQLGDVVTQRLADGYIRQPRVSVNVMEYASHQVTVEGAVETPGVYTFRPGTRLSGAIAMAEGPTRIAKLRELAVFRQKPDGMYVAKFDYAAIQQGQMLDPVLEPGDRVVVGTSGLSQAWQDLLLTVPVFALFTRI